MDDATHVRHPMPQPIEQEETGMMGRPSTNMREMVGLVIKSAELGGILHEN